jgi:8-oxo-dGTP diphosphatase
MSKPTRFRVSVVALFVDQQDVLLIHQMTPPEPNCWDLPGGGLKPEESLLEGLQREVREETGIADFQTEGFLTLWERFYPEGDGQLHTLNIVYRCSVTSRPTQLYSDDAEIGPKGIQWLPIAQLNQDECSSRVWAALTAAKLVSG